MSVSQSLRQEKIDKFTFLWIFCFCSIIAVECFCDSLLQIWFSVTECLMWSTLNVVRVKCLFTLVLFSVFSGPFHSYILISSENKFYREVVPFHKYCHMMHGDVWKQFTTTEFNNFLETPYSFLVTINVDCLQPFVRTVYSTGAIYLTIQNLPRHKRYRQENVILVGVVPVPKEPKLQLNSYLTLFVEELQEFWTGVILQSVNKGQIIPD